MPDITGEQQISDSAWGGQQFLLAASRPSELNTEHIYGTMSVLRSVIYG